MAAASGDSIADAARHAAEAAARASYGKLVAFLAARTRDVAGAEDALAEAFAAALAEWPERGVPRTPEAWLLTVARRRRVDALRQQRLQEGAAERFALLAELADLPEGSEEGSDAAIPDRRLGLLFACAHPAIDAGVRAPLMLQVVLGFDAATIASAFLVAPAAMGQRLSRAKARIRQAGIAFAVPGRGEDLRERLAAVLDAVYAAYAEGWSDPQGGDATRRNLAEEALWLGRLVAALLPAEGEALGLLSLMLHAHARRHARRDSEGNYVPLAAQDPARWDTAMIDEADALLLRANALGGSGRYQLEAAVQTAHAARRLHGRTDWRAIEQLYDALVALTGSPVAALNHAVAVAEVRGPAAGLAALGAIGEDQRLATYQPWWAAKAELLSRCGHRAQALAAYEQAIGLERDPAVRRFLQQRAARLAAAT
ncbi:MAG: RNA polymerase subunit sigma-70 [Rubrivivax sp.]|nr:RNA polymerase subunit sigma-70 [Rubrivivax sp.]